MHRKQELTKKQQKTLATVAVCVLILVLVLITLLVGGPMIRFASEPEKFRRWVEEQGILGPLLYAGMVFLQVVVAIIPGEPLEIVGGYAFGAVEGTIVCLLAAWLGGLAVFALVRRFGVRLVEVFFPMEKLRNLRFLKSSPGRVMLFLLIFMTPGTPKDLLCYYAGLTDMKLTVWLLISSLGRIPSVVTSTIGGDALGNESYLFAAIVFAATFLISAAGLMIYNHICKRHGTKNRQEEHPVEQEVDIRDRFRGCLIGGAAGDALGYAVEFEDAEHIFARYGKTGITDYRLSGGVAQISDDTQMTLFTANGLLLPTENGTGGERLANIFACYQDWLKTQYSAPGQPTKGRRAWLNRVPQLNFPRAPGNTCLSAIEGGIPGSVASPCNNSKGCGGIMRVAPVGLCLQPLEAAALGAETAALTHGHPLGYMPAAALAHMVSNLVHNPGLPLEAVVTEAMDALRQLYGNQPHLPALLELMQKAVDLSGQELNDLTAVGELGEGWVAEETLAIAVYCSLKYSDDFDRAIIASVNHSGDSDSTGAVTGNLLGAYLGLSRIPRKYLDQLELRDIIMEMADDLFDDPRGTETWKGKYSPA